MLLLAMALLSAQAPAPDLVRLYDRASAATVLVLGQSPGGACLAAGTTVAPGGLVITSDSVLCGATLTETQARVYFRPSDLRRRGVDAVADTAPAKLIARDGQAGLLLLQLPARPGGYPYLPPAPGDASTGGPGFAIGHPERSGLWSMAQLQPAAGGHGFEAPGGGLPPGFSGGPIVNVRGQLVGIAQLPPSQVQLASAGTTGPWPRGRVAATVPVDSVDALISGAKHSKVLLIAGCDANKDGQSDTTCSYFGVPDDHARQMNAITDGMDAESRPPPPSVPPDWHPPMVVPETAPTGGSGSGATTAPTDGSGSTAPTGGSGSGATTAPTGGSGSGAATEPTGGSGSGATTAPSGGDGGGATTAIADAYSARDLLARLGKLAAQSPAAAAPATPSAPPAEPASRDALARLLATGAFGAAYDMAEKLVPRNELRAYRELRDGQRFLDKGDAAKARGCFGRAEWLEAVRSVAQRWGCKVYEREGDSARAAACWERYPSP